MRVALFIACLLLFPSSSVQAANTFFAIAATPTPLSDERYAAVVYKIQLNGGGIEKLRNLVPAKYGVSFVKSNQDAGLLLLGYPADSPSHIEKFDVTSPDASVTLPLLPSKCTGCIYIDSSLVSAKNVSKIQLRLRIKSEDVREYDLPLVNGATPKFSTQSFESVEDRVVDGVPGPAIAGDFFYLTSKPKTATQAGNLLNTVPSLGFSLPPAFKHDEREILVVLGSNSRYLVLTSNRNRIINDGIGFTTYYVLDRRTGGWRSIVLPGNRTDVRLFGDWIAASVATGVGGGPQAGGGSSLVSRVTGNSVEQRSVQFRLNLQKKLIVASLSTGEVDEWATDNPDSEVLMIRDATVIYRVWDSLYQRGINAANARLLIRDERILDVHWLFYEK